MEQNFLNGIIDFSIEDSSTIKVFDCIDGTIEDGFKVIFDTNCEIIVKPIFYLENNHIYYTNKLVSILYY